MREGGSRERSRQGGTEARAARSAVVRDDSIGREPSVLVVARHPVGGIRSWMQYVYGHSSFSGVRLTFLLPDFKEARDLARRLEIPRVDWRWTDPHPVTIARSLYRLAREKTFDVVHAHGYTAGVLAAIAAPRRARLIITYHEVLEGDQFSNHKGRLMRLAIRASMARADLIHAVSVSAAENLVANFRSLSSAGKITVVANGIDVNRFRTGAVENPREAMGWPRDTFVVGFFGRFMNPKGFRVLLAALEYLIETDRALGLRILAVGTGGFRAREQRYIAERGLEPYFGFVDTRSDIGPLLRSVDVVAMPSLWEACGLLAMETLACGTPLICTDCPALLEVTEGSPAHVVRRGDSRALAEAILREVESPTRRAAHRYADSACERFDVARTSDQVRRLYGL